MQLRLLELQIALLNTCAGIADDFEWNRRFTQRNLLDAVEAKTNKRTAFALSIALLAFCAFRNSVKSLPWSVGRICIDCSVI